MAIRVYKPTSPARRFMSVLTYEEITKKTPEKSLCVNPVFCFMRSAISRTPIS